MLRFGPLRERPLVIGPAVSLLCHAASLVALALVPRPVPTTEPEIVPVELVSLAAASAEPAKEWAAAPEAALPSSEPPTAPEQSVEMPPPPALEPAPPQPLPPPAPPAEATLEAAMMPITPPLPVMPPLTRPKVMLETPRPKAPARADAPAEPPPVAPAMTAPVASPAPPAQQAALPQSSARQVDAALAKEALGHYVSRLHVLIAAHKSYPTQALIRGEGGTVTLYIALEHDGQLDDVTARSNASSLLVAASIEAVKAAAPFPPFPLGLDQQRATFEVPIVFKLQ